MHSPFRSTRAFATRRQVRPAVERATFVIASVGVRHYAVPVEWVERVLRPEREVEQSARAGLPAPPASQKEPHQECQPVPRNDLATVLGEVGNEEAAVVRLLALRPRTPDGRGGLWRVGAVHEVVAVDTASVRPVTGTEADAPAHVAVRGYFERADRTVWVLDPQRLPDPS